MLIKKHLTECLTSLVLIVLAAISMSGSERFDKYGGLKKLGCREATGWFHIEKIANHWWLCTPLGNVFYAQMVAQVISPDDAYYSAIRSKYGGAIPWTVATNRRLESWGFNSLTTGAYIYNLPIGTDRDFPVDPNGVRSQPIKMPFTTEVRPAYYSMRNPLIGTRKLLGEPVKNMIRGHSPFYKGYVPAGGVADYYDQKMGNWLERDLEADPAVASLVASPYKDYLIGIAVDDGDEMYGFGTAPNFTTKPAGHNSSNLAMQVAAMSPCETANSDVGVVYSDTQIYSKTALRDFLKSKYRMIAALNEAWNSQYSTFDSSGKAIEGELVGTGNGLDMAFNHELSYLRPSQNSIRVLLNGSAIAGEEGNGQIWGPSVTGYVNSKTGLISVAFTQAPSPGAQITVDYIQNGWGIGTGFMDEDARPAHLWMGSDWIAMRDANSNFQADMNDFLEQLASQYFQSTRNPIRKLFPHTLYLGPDALNGWGIPAPGPVLRAARGYVDAFITASAGVFDQSEMDFIAVNYGDGPYFGSFYSVANPDSALRAYENFEGGFKDQSARGQAYYHTVLEQLHTAHTSSGTFPYIGIYWWEYADNWSEKLNWGLVTHFDNAYDGREDVIQSTPCAGPISKSLCGGEQFSSGDLIDWVKRANALWLDSPRVGVQGQ